MIQMFWNSIRSILTNFWSLKKKKHVSLAILCQIFPKIKPAFLKMMKCEVFSDFEFNF